MTSHLDPADEYREIAGRFTELVEAVPDDATWVRPAPVPGWTARDVVGHLVGWFPGFLTAGAGAILPSGPDVGVDTRAAWQVFSNGVQQLLDDPSSASRIMSNPYIGSMPVPDAVSRFFTSDVFLHSWDLARATGQDDTLDPERCSTMLRGMEPLDELLRSSGQYGPRFPVSDHADPQAKLMAFIGRDPDWRPPTPS